MKRNLLRFAFMFLTFVLAINQVNAKSIYYVKAGATGDGSSWSNASGNIQEMIDKASPGDEVWIAGGTYYPPKSEKGRERPSFKLKVGVSMFGGFSGTEQNIEERSKEDRDKNGTIDSWEYENEVILSGDCDNVPDKWTIDDKNRVLTVLGFDNNSEYVLRLLDGDFKDNTIQYNNPFYLSGISVVGGEYGFYSLCAYNPIIQECDFSFNEIGICNRGGLGNDIVIMNSDIHHNITCGISCSTSSGGGKSIKSYIHHNLHKGIECSSVEYCTIYHNGKDGTSWDHYAGGVYADTIRVSSISENIGVEGAGVYGSVIYDSQIFDNIALEKGGGIANTIAYNCMIYNNQSNNVGGGVADSYPIGCSIYNNEALTSAGGCANSSCYSCDIYNNYAPLYGGTEESNLYNCTITNNESFSGNNNNGRLYSTIMAESFDGYASYSILTDSYISGIGNFLATEKELKFQRPTLFVGLAENETQLQELENADFSLSTASIAIDAGEQSHNQTIAIVDRNGNPRPMGEKVDIGSHECIAYTTLPYQNKFDDNSFSMLGIGWWKIGILSGKNGSYLYFGKPYSDIKNICNYVTTPFFTKSSSTQINLSFDFTGKYKTTDQKEMMHVILAYEDSNKRDTIATYRNTAYTLDYHFSKEISQWVRNKVFRVIFAVEGVGYDNNIDYAGITNLSITKQDGSVEISAKDAVVTYDGKPHAITYQINDERVDKSKVVVSYQKEGEEAISTPPVNAGVYAVTISVNDGELAGIKEVKLTIEKAYQNIVWEQTLGTLNALDRIQLKATSSSGLPVEFESDDETIARVEKVGEEWWLVADTLDGEATIRAFQLGNENYNLANSLLKTVRVKAPEEVVTGIDGISNADIKVYYVKSGNYIQIDNVAPGSMYYLYNSLGRLTASGDIQSSNLKVQTYREESGLHYLLIVNKDGKESFKVLINK